MIINLKLLAEFDGLAIKILKASSLEEKIALSEKISKLAKVNDISNVVPNGKINIQTLEKVGLVFPFKFKGQAYAMVFPDKTKLIRMGIDVSKYGKGSGLLRGISKQKQDELLLQIYENNEIFRNRLGHASYSVAKQMLPVIDKALKEGQISESYNWIYFILGNETKIEGEKQQEIIFPKSSYDSDSLRYYFIYLSNVEEYQRRNGYEGKYYYGKVIFIAKLDD